jgi:hypothetical protein
VIKLSLPEQIKVEPLGPIQQPEQPKKFSEYGFVAVIQSGAIGLLIGFLVGINFQSFDFFQDNQEKIVDPDNDQKQSDTDKIEAADSVFVFVYEFQTKTADQELLVRDLRAWSEIKKCKFRQFDQDSEDANPYKAAAEKAGLKSPFLAVVRDGKIVRVFDWPRDREALERLVK